ncbi:MAG: hypothetical protein MJ124_08480 [Lachnospiraceae bacterium]|nr:hypothetical protein [Lachnospiraceae bacterium]
MKRKIKVILSALLLMSLAFSAGGHMSLAAVDNGTEIPEKNIKILYEEESVLIDEKDMAKKDTVIYYTTVYSDDMSKWWQCEVRNNQAMFDFSWINTSSNEKVYICGDQNKKKTSINLVWKENFTVSFTGSLPATDITDSEEWQDVYKSYPKFGNDTGYMIFQKRVNNKLTTYTDLDTIEWRKGNEGIWRDYDELDLHEMQIRGGQLQFRIKASNANGNRYSTIAKYTIARVSGGPSVSVANTTGTISLRNGLEFSTDRIHWTLIPAYNARGTTDETFVEESDREGAIQTITTTKKVVRLTVQEALGLRTGDNVPQTVVYVRNASTDRSAAARVTTVTIPASLTINNTDVQNGITMEYCLSKTGTGGIEIFNKNPDSYQVVVISPVEQQRYGIDPSNPGTMNNIPVADFTWTTIRSDSSTKVVYKKAPTGSIILVRKAGTEENLASRYIVHNITVDNESALTYAAISGSPRKLCQLSAVPSTNISKTDPGITYLWQYCSSKSSADSDWTDLATTRDITIDGDVYTKTLGKYIRVKMTYKGVTQISNAVGTVK